MEKVKVDIIRIKKEGLSKEGKPYKLYEVQLMDGRKGDSFSDFLNGEECEIEIKENANPAYNPFFIKAGVIKKAGGFAPKDYTFEKRKVALECATSLIVAGKFAIDQQMILTERFFEYLNKK